MKTVVIFPYHPDIHILIQFKEELCNYCLGGFVSFKDDQTLISELNRKLGIIGDDEEELIKSSDCLVVLENYRDYKIEKYIDIIHLAISMGKEVLVSPQVLTTIDLSHLNGKYTVLKNNILDYQQIEKEKDYRLNNTALNRLYRIDTPVVGVLGQGKCCGKFETVVGVSKNIKNRYSTEIICANPLGVLFGFHTAPDFLFEDRPFQDKIIMFNIYIWRLLQLCPTDLLLLEVPEGFVPFSEKEFNHFAESAFILSNAVSIDIGIMCIYYLYGTGAETAIDQSAKYCEERFRIPTKIAVISRTHVEIPDQEMDPIQYEVLNKPVCNERYSNDANKRIVVDVFNKESFSKIADFIVTMLSGSPGVI